MFIMIMISDFLFIFINFWVTVTFLTKLLTLGFLLSITLRETLVAKLVILGISTLTSFILALRVVLVAKFVILGILYSIFYVSITWIFFNNIFFLLYCLVYLKKQVLIYQHLVYLLYFPNCSNYLNQCLNLSLSNLSQLDFKWAESTFFTRFLRIDTCCIFWICFCCVIRQI